MGFDPQQLINLIPLAVGAFKPGSPQAAAMIRGFQNSQNRIHQQGLADTESKRRNELMQSQIANTNADNARADQLLQMQQQQQALTRLSGYQNAANNVQQVLQQHPETIPADTDPLQSQNALVLQRLSQQQQFGVPAGTPQGPLPNMTQLISQGKKRRAQAIVDKFDKTYGDQAREAETSMRLHEGEFAGMSMQEIRGLTDVPITPPGPKKTQRALQSKDVIRSGKREKVNFDPTTGEYFDLTGNKITDIAPIPPVSQGGIGEAGGLTPEGVDYAATQYRVTGVMPPMGMASGGARTAIVNAAAAQTKMLGQAPAHAIQKQAAYKADAGALTQMRKMSSSAESYESKALGQAEIVSGLSNKVSRTQYPIINDALLAGKARILGDQNTQLLFNALTTFTSEYAKIMEGSTGSSAASSDSARSAAAHLISAGLNNGTLQATLDLMKREMALTISGYGATIDHITSRMGGAPPDSSTQQLPPGVTVTRLP